MECSKAILRAFKPFSSRWIFSWCKRGRLSHHACTSRNTAIQGHQHQQLPQLIPQSILMTKRVSTKCPATRCIRDRERINCCWCQPVRLDEPRRHAHSEIPVMYYHHDVTATIYLLQIMFKFECTWLIYSSSVTVYSTPPIVPIPKTTWLKVNSSYGQSKTMCDSVRVDHPGSHTRYALPFMSCRGGWLSCHSRTLVACYLPEVLQFGRCTPIQSDRQGPVWKTR